MAHPDLLAGADLPYPVEQDAIVFYIDKGTPELAMVGGFDTPAKLVAHGLLAVADAQHRKAGVENKLRCPWRFLGDHGGRSAREDIGLGPERLDLLDRCVEGHDFAIDTSFADTARDQLCDLTAEIENENTIGHRAPFGWAGMKRRKLPELLHCGKAAWHGSG